MIDVRLHMGCESRTATGVYLWGADFCKDVKMPALLPIGSVVFPVDGECEFDGQTIEDYMWFEHNGRIDCHVSECSNISDTIEEWSRKMVASGWRPDTWN